MRLLQKKDEFKELSRELQPSKHRFKFKFNLKLFALVLITVLAVSSFVVLYKPSSVSAQTPQFLTVTISPSSPVTMTVGQPVTFTAEVANASLAPFSYVWTDETGLL